MLKNIKLKLIKIRVLKVKKDYFFLGFQIFTLKTKLLLNQSLSKDFFNYKQLYVCENSNTFIA